MARIRGIADARIVDAISREHGHADRAGRHPAFLTSHQVASILKVRLNSDHIQVKVTLHSNPNAEFPLEAEVWLSVRQLDDELQLRVRDHLRFTGASALIGQEAANVE